ncbi:MAG: tetratricopeptide repeat protein [Thermodesulfobacteriota bacterium]
MENKIKWFKEFLEIEPNSKIFFPLARLLHEDGRTEEAVETLKRGVEKHPDHLEARFFLVELLAERGQDDGASREADGLASTLSQYPAFWQVWAERSAPKSRDSALALSFLASTFRGRSITWSQVIEEGLKALFANEGISSPAFQAEAEVVGEVHFEAAPDIEYVEEEVPAAPGLDMAAEAAATYAASSPEEAIAQVLAEEAGPESEEFALEPEPGPDEEAGDESEGNIRTRTMADLLADQGDYKGALAIYRELAAAAQGDEADELEGLAATMQSKLRRGAGAPAPAREKRPEPAPLPGKEKLLSTLEALAERLEARAQA